MKAEPLNPQLNAAVWTIANRCFPMGWDVAGSAPDTLAGLQAEAKARGRITVWNGASDDTIYADPETNWASRAWHDWCHVRYSLPLTIEGERAAAYVQVAHLVRLYGDGEDVEAMAALILTEVLGHAQAFGSHGVYPPNQRVFTTSNAWRFRAMAERLVADFDMAEASDHDAIRQAHRDAPPFANHLAA